MHFIDIIIFSVYAISMLFIGFYFYKKNKSVEDYYVGGRSMGAWHVGLSVVATDVGGGFSIGLGGLGFTMGISGSWMLFTGLIGAWLSAVLLIPKMSRLSQKINLLTFPQIFGHHFNKTAALIAAGISFIGYLGFTSSQLLAGAKLASATFPAIDMTYLLLFMGIFTVVYTAFGGMKAVIYTDTIQWIILMAGLLFIGVPFAYYAIGGYEAITSTLGPEFLSFTNITWQQIVNWSITIIPVWFIGMTLYQRIFACRTEKEAQKAWFIAGLFEWPIMAILGVVLGLFARVAFEQGMFESIQQLDPELGLPLLLTTVLPVGLMGLLMAAYFSAIMSTADSCLMAASGNFLTDILGHFFKITDEKAMRYSIPISLLLGSIAIGIAMLMTSVLDLMLLSYAFMVSGLFIPVLAILFVKKIDPRAAIISMISGGGTTLILILLETKIPYGLDANVFGISISLLSFILSNYLFNTLKTTHGNR